MATEVASLLGVSVPTAFRTLTALVRSGFAERNPSGSGYRPSLKVLELAGGVMGQVEVKDIVRTDLVEFAQQFGETVTLATPNKDSILFLDRVDAGNRVRFYCDIGRSLPLHAGAASRAVLAHLPDAQFEAYISRPLETLTSQTKVSARRLRQDRDEIRHKGYAVSHGEVDLGVSAVAAAILNDAGLAIASVSIANLTSTWSQTDVLRRARACRDLCARLSRRCAGVPVVTELVI